MFTFLKTMRVRTGVIHHTCGCHSDKSSIIIGRHNIYTQFCIRSKTTLAPCNLIQVIKARRLSQFTLGQAHNFCHEPVTAVKVLPTTVPQRRRSHRQGSAVKCVLGIETSCDDTGAAVVDEHGNILGEEIQSQTKLHVQLGGIIPPIARDLHKQNIDEVVQTALQKSGLLLSDVDAIATTVKPGLALSLQVGLDYTRDLIRTSKRPFIPIHHMEAHALTARMIHRVEFPFLVLLISGGHCLLAVARGVDDFLLLGKSMDIAPGDAFDKLARRLKLQNLPECDGLSGGRAIELMAQSGNPAAFTFRQKVHKFLNCDFSFSGLRTAMEGIVRKEEEAYNIRGGDVLPNAADICASTQYFVLRHLGNRLQRGFLFCDQNGLLPNKDRTLVISGGVASNSYLRSGLEKLCNRVDAKLICPPVPLCTDNGIMIAWNGMEKLLENKGFADPETTEIQPRCPLGVDISQEVNDAAIKVKRFKL